MKKKLFLFICFILFGSLLNANGKPHLTVWIRSFGADSARIILPYVEQIKNELEEEFQLKILVATKPNDPVLTAFTDPHPSVTVLQTNLDSISQGLNALIESSSSGSYVLSLSQGVEIHATEIKEAMPQLDNGAWAYGWQLSNLNNDGSAPGKGWYHTAALYPPATLKWMKTHLFPNWIDTGVDGYLTIDGEKIPIANNEEVVLMATVLQEHPKAFFVLNTRDILNFNNRTGNGVSFQQKLKRKIPVADFYLRNRFHVKPEEVWSHLVIISSEK